MRFRRFLYVIAVSGFILSIFISSIQVIAFNKAYYKSTYRHYNTAEEIGISKDDLTQATNVLLDYLNDKTDTLDLKVNVNGKTEEMFNQKEKDHMIDVKVLYQNALTFRNIMGIFIAIMLLLSLGVGDYVDFRLNRDVLKTSLIVLGTVFGFIGAFAIVDFQSFWIKFHEIVFTNDLWLLDPSTDRLIMMVPEPFFMGLVFQIIAAAVVILGCAFGALVYLNRLVKRSDTRGIV